MRKFSFLVSIFLGFSFLNVAFAAKSGSYLKVQVTNEQCASNSFQFDIGSCRDELVGFQVVRCSKEAMSRCQEIVFSTV
jgi:hypothetical protein